MPTFNPFCVSLDLIPVGAWAWGTQMAESPNIAYSSLPKPWSQSGNSGSQACNQSPNEIALKIAIRGIMFIAI